MPDGIHICDAKLRCLSMKECSQQLIFVLGDKTTSIRTIYRWVNEFQLGFIGISDEFRQGLSSTTIVPANIDAVLEIIKVD